MRLTATFACLATYFCSFGQISFSSDVVEFCNWNDSLDNYDNCQQVKRPSLFELNKSESIIQHINDLGTATYFVKSKEYITGYKVYGLYTVDEQGDNYLFVFDLEGMQIRVLYYVDGKAVYSIFYLKSIFTPD